MALCREQLHLLHRHEESLKAVCAVPSVPGHAGSLIPLAVSWLSSAFPAPQGGAASHKPLAFALSVSLLPVESNTRCFAPVLQPNTEETCFRGSNQMRRGVMGLKPFRSLLPNKNGASSLETRPIFLSSGSIDMFQRGTWRAFHQLSSAQEQPGCHKGKQDSRP